MDRGDREGDSRPVDSKKTRWASGDALHCTIRLFVLGYWLTVCLRSFFYVKDIFRGRSYPFRIDYQYGVRGMDGSVHWMYTIKTLYYSRTSDPRLV